MASQNGGLNYVELTEGMLNLESDRVFESHTE